MIPFRRSQTFEARTVKLDCVSVAGDKAVFGAAEVEGAFRFVDLFERTHVPIAPGDLLDELAVGSVMIDVPPAAAVAEPQKRSIIQPLHARVNYFDPGLRRLAQ